MSLSRKILILLVVPAIFQLGLLATVATLQNKAEAEAEAALKSARLSSAVNALSNEIFTVVATNGGEMKLRRNLIENTDLGTRFDQIQSEMEVIRSLIGNDTNKLEAFDKSEQIFLRCQQIIGQIRKSYREKGEEGTIERIPMWKNLMQIATNDMFRELKQAAEVEREKSEQGPGKQREFRNLSLLITLVLGGLTAASTAALGVYLLRSVTDRLNIMRDNTVRLANSKPLNPPLVGGDEIATLDQTFHQMAESLLLAKRKETALVQNAQDIICSISSDLRFTSINPAVETMLEYFVDEVENKPVLQFVAADYGSKIMEYMTKVKKGEKALPEEVLMTSRRGESVYTLWSAQWSSEQKTFFCVIHDITERQLAAKMKQDITAMVNHDIRSPITTLTVALAVLKSGKHGQLSPEGEKLIERGNRSCERILHLTKDLLDLDKIEGGHIELTILPTSLDEVFKSAIDTTSGIAENRNIKVEVQQTNLRVLGDQARLEQVLINLLSNALKFSPIEGRVRLSAVASDNQVVVAVQDQGPGIPVDMQEKIFEPFTQLKQTDRQAKEGTGLGLAICKQLIQMHQGQIWVESKPGQGSTFLFCVPQVKDLPFQ